MSKRPAILFLGDSLTYGYMVPPAESIPARIEQRLKPTWIMINGGVPGDTVELAARRLPYYFENFSNIQLMVIFLGANDFLMHENPVHVESDFQNLIATARNARPALRIRIVAFGPLPGSATEYQEQFTNIYRRLAAEIGTELIPFPMKDITGNPRLNLEDGLHPNGEGYRIIADRLWPHIETDVALLTESLSDDGIADDE